MINFNKIMSPPPRKKESYLGLSGNRRSTWKVHLCAHLDSAMLQVREGETKRMLLQSF